MKQYKGLLFDLDGVIVDTAKYHYLAWKALADELGIPFSQTDNERLKGVSRMASLEIILEIDKRTMSKEEKEANCTKKNDLYVSYIKNLEKHEILPGVEAFLTDAREKGYKIALGSASKNSGLILDRLGIRSLFDEIIDGTKVTIAKPDPEVFVKGSEALGLEVGECIVFEDAIAGIEAAHNGGMKAVGIGLKSILVKADEVLPGFKGITIDDVIALL
ncbi:beta-phosphoglucomutase [uncultured Sphaerochaeta sp.]|uniref:beta-phosphoglucomutase n=1 Tax=uncultured Sphaerochaeta sp. TaxID=886478 RepID=UPI002A0A89BB|nr:beta-phosphoglucomutase [uncultured Sphaerochaeta sp.]